MANNGAYSVLADEAALRWLARKMAGDMDAVEEKAFCAWLDASDANRAAYAEAERLWQEMEPLGPALRRDLARERAVVNETKVSRRRFAAWAAIAASIAVIATGFWWRIHDTGPMVIASAVGEGRSVALNDGSTIHVGADSEVVVDITPHRRTVTLRHGEAFFSVARNDTPFVVAAENVAVTVRGTEFNVKLGERLVTVAVQSGRVETSASPSSVATATTTQLAAGDQLEITKATAAGRKTRIEPRDAAAWRLGRLIYHETPLEEVVADLNRQFQSKIVLATPSIGQMKLTGVIVLGEQAPVVKAITGALPLAAYRKTNGLIVLTTPADS